MLDAQGLKDAVEGVRKFAYLCSYFYWEPERRLQTYQQSRNSNNDIPKEENYDGF